MLFNKSVILSCALALGMTGCDIHNEQPVSASGVGKATVKIPVGSDGLTTEQRNISKRLQKDNEPGSMKYLYIISAYTGDVLMFSTVDGKVTSGGKRLTPTSVTARATNDTVWCSNGFEVDIGGREYCTSEVLQDDGTYGSSGEYIYWWDTKGVYRQLGLNGATWLVSDQPLTIKHVTLNLDTGAGEQSVDSAPAAAKVTGKK